MDHEPGPVRGDCTVAFRREVALVQTILSALAPIVFTLLLGFVAAWRHDFGPKEASVLNRMVLLYAVPLALFVGTVGTPRADLVQDITLVVALFAAIVGLLCAGFSAVPFRISLFVERERIGGTDCVRSGSSVHGSGHSRRPVRQS
jgi:predicted permease